MIHTFRPRGVCSQLMRVEVENGIIKDVEVKGGCDGNLQGISAIIDLAHRIISLYRVQEKDKQGEPKLNGSGWRVKPIKADVIIDILKDRLTGYESRSIEVFYDRPSKRFFTTEAELDYRYKWDKTPYKTPLPFPPQQLLEAEEDDEVFGTINQ